MNYEPLNNLENNLYKHTHKIRLLFIGLVMASSTTLFSRAITLEDAMQLTQYNNPKIHQYEEKSIQKKYLNRVAFGNFLPSVSVNAGVTHMKDPLEIDLSPIREVILQMQTSNQVQITNANLIAQGLPPLSTEQNLALSGQAYQQLDGLIPPFSETLKERDYNTATLIAVQPIFLGGKLVAAKKAAKADKEATEFEYDHVSNGILKTAVEQYINVLLLKHVVETREFVLEGMNMHLSDAEKLYKQGLIAKYNLLRAQVAVADADKKSFDDKNNLDLAKLALKKTLALDESMSVQTVDSLAYKQITLSLDDFTKGALEHQPLLNMLTEKNKMARQNYVAKRADYLPTIVGVGKYEMYPEYLSALEPRWAAGVQVSYNIFDGAKRYHRLQEAKHKQKEVEYIKLDMQDQIELWVNKSYTEMRNAEKRLQKLDTNIALASESLKLNEKRFKSGLGTSLEVVDAQLALEKNLVDKLVSLADYYKAMADLYYAKGRPSEILMVWQQ
jgi:outer membrane protein TolC